MGREKFRYREMCRQTGSKLAYHSKYFFSMYGNVDTTLLLHILEEREWK